jgi:plasmid stability protein
MPGMIQIRHVPDAIHRRLKAKAAMEGMSLSDYLRQEVVEIAARPTVSELRQRLAERASVRTQVTPAQAVRSERENR